MNRKRKREQIEETETEETDLWAYPWSYLKFLPTGLCRVNSPVWSQKPLCMRVLSEPSGILDPFQFALLCLLHPFHFVRSESIKYRGIILLCYDKEEDERLEKSYEACFKKKRICSYLIPSCRRRVKKKTDETHEQYEISMSLAEEIRMVASVRPQWVENARNMDRYKDLPSSKFYIDYIERLSQGWLPDYFVIDKSVPFTILNELNLTKVLIFIILQYL